MAHGRPGRELAPIATDGHLNFGPYRPVVPASLPAGYPGEVLWLQGYYGGYRRFRTWVNVRAGLPAPPAVVTVSHAVRLERDRGRSGCG